MDSKKNNRKRRYRAMAYGNKKSKQAVGKNVIQESLQGFIIVCNGREKEAIREAYRILNETHESVQPDSDVEEESVEDALAKERAELSSEDKNFQLMYTAGVSNFMFLKSVPEPLPLATKIMDSILRDGQQRTRYLIRLIPIQNVCKAFPDPIKACVKALIPQQNLDKEPLTYCVAYKSRFNNNINQTEAHQAVNEAVKDATNGGWTIQLKGSDYVIVLEVVTSYCCIGILPKYHQKRKYNLIELAKSVSNEVEAKVADEGGKKDSTATKKDDKGDQNHEEQNKDSTATKKDDKGDQNHEEQNKDSTATKKDDKGDQNHEEQNKDSTATKKDDKGDQNHEEQNKDSTATKKDDKGDQNEDSTSTEKDDKGDQNHEGQNEDSTATDNADNVESKNGETENSTENTIQSNEETPS